MTPYDSGPRRRPTIVRTRRQLLLDSRQAPVHRGETRLDIVESTGHIQPQIVDPLVERPGEVVDALACCPDEGMERPSEDEQHQATADVQEDLLRVHSPRIVDAPRAVEYGACNYGEVTSPPSDGSRHD